MTSSQGNQNLDDLLLFGEEAGFEDVHIKSDPHTGLLAFVAIHSTQLGPALGGCRFLAYPHSFHALQDALRLAQMMSYKNALAGLDFGGGKAVIMMPEIKFDREALMQRFGRFLAELGGRYVTAVDSGTSPKDMDQIAKQTKFATCTSKEQAGGDPSPWTAKGVCLGIQAAVSHKLGQDKLKGLRIGVQGVGHVGYQLVRELTELGAVVTIADTNQQALHKCASDFEVAMVSPEEILRLDCEVLSPCSLGGVIHQANLDQIKAGIIAGCANNQLDQWETGRQLHQRGILYAPDFVINAGGVLRVAYSYQKKKDRLLEEKVQQIKKTLKDIFQNSDLEDRPPLDIALEMAKDILESAPKRAAQRMREEAP